jgi:hypothetical protein
MTRSASVTDQSECVRTPHTVLWWLWASQTDDLQQTFIKGSPLSRPCVSGHVKPSVWEFWRVPLRRRGLMAEWRSECRDVVHNARGPGTRRHG